MNANRNLRRTGSELQKSLERLSSGLRINRAADDAAGLSISENLRSQIRGLDRASSNALDGISLIQTAEGALNETTSILQRVRELSVQAANGVLTANDRQAIQQEVNQLIDEIDRIAQTTEFNTRKLLDGTMGALISTDDPTKLRGSVVDNVGKGGNFVLNKQVVDSGQLQVQKSDVFTTIQEQDAVGKLNFLDTVKAHAKLESGADIGSTGLSEIVIGASSGNTLTGKDATFELADTGSDGAIEQAGNGQVQLESLVNSQNVNLGDKFELTVSTAAGEKTFEAVYASAGAVSAGAGPSNEFNQVASLTNALSFAGGGDVSTASSFSNGQSYFNLDSGVDFKDFAFVDSSVDSEAQDAGIDNPSKIHLSFASLGGSGSFASNITMSSAEVEFQGNAQSIAGGTAQQVQNAAGDETLFVRLDPSVVDEGLYSSGAAQTFNGYNGPQTTFVDENFNTEVRSGKTDQIITGDDVGDPSGGPNQLVQFGEVTQVSTPSQNGTYLVSASGEQEYAVFEFDNAAYTDAVADGQTREDALQAARGPSLGYDQNGNTSLQTSDFRFDPGTLFNGDLAKASQTSSENPLEGVRLRFDATFQPGETATFNVSTNNVLTADQATTLGSVSRFQDLGVFQGKNNVTFDIFVKGQNRSAEVNITKNDTLETMAGKVSLALADPSRTDDLNLEGGINFEQAPDLVHVNTIGEAKGTISITSPSPGADIQFSGGEEFLKAMSLIENQEGKSPIYSVTATNVETGEQVGQVRADSDEINGLLPGVKVFFDPTAQLTLDPKPPTGDQNADISSQPFNRPDTRPALSATQELDSEFIHVAPRGFQLQIGPNQGQNISSFIRDLSSEALGVEGLLVTNEELAQESISRVDKALTQVTDERSRLGALQNRLEATIRNLDVARENLSASESRIRDVDVAEETVKSTRLQIKLQAGTSALAQANQLPQNVLQLLQ